MFTNKSHSHCYKFGYKHSHYYEFGHKHKKASFGKINNNFTVHGYHC